MQPLVIRSPPATSAHSRYAGVGFFISALSLTRSRLKKTVYGDMWWGFTVALAASNPTAL
jgi:hypothetical protein